ncbi:hypothetical protein TXIAM_370083 [Tenacibaculum xiamenense]
MGIPWQSDAGSCQKVFLDSQYPIPAWWAANLPVDILTEESLVAMRNKNISPETIQYLYANREAWLSTTDTGFVGYHAEGGYLNGLINMVYKWKDIGVVAARKSNVNGVPSTVYVGTTSVNKKDLTYVSLGEEISKTVGSSPLPNVFYSNVRDMIWIPADKKIILASPPNNNLDVFVSDTLVLKVNGEIILEINFQLDSEGKPIPQKPEDITSLLKKHFNSFVTIEISYVLKQSKTEYDVKQSSSGFGLYFNPLNSSDPVVHSDSDLINA